MPTTLVVDDCCFVLATVFEGVETNAFEEPMVAAVQSSSAADIFMLLVLFL